MPVSLEVSSAFAALGDPTRLAILSRLADHGEMTVQEIAQPFAMSLPAVSQHLKVLEHAGQAMTWLNFTRRAWESRFDRLERFLHDTSQSTDPKGTENDSDK
ncbi:MAG: metalloregulator ArsR/SmtB family transcription factor [Alphaproteobacteria bacterium]|nr:metalloregulator ArsR/SmtB family transcription factor [Alphaproteobacteria bacterium]